MNLLWVQHMNDAIYIIRKQQIVIPLCQFSGIVNRHPRWFLPFFSQDFGGVFQQKPPVCFKKSSPWMLGQFLWWSSFLPTTPKGAWVFFFVGGGRNTPRLTWVAKGSSILSRWFLFVLYRGMLLITQLYRDYIHIFSHILFWNEIRWVGTCGCFACGPTGLCFRQAPINGRR